MDISSLLKLFHVLGVVLLGGGLAAVFVSEFRAYGATDGRVFTEAARFTAIFYDALVVPGAIMIGASGYFLLDRLGISFFDAPWVVGMWGGFVFEMVEGNTLTRLQFRRTLRISEAAVGSGRYDASVRHEARNALGQFVHFLDLPMVGAILWCAIIRPQDWAEVMVAFMLAGFAGLVLMLVVPRLAAVSAHPRS